MARAGRGRRFYIEPIERALASRKANAKWSAPWTVTAICKQLWDAWFTATSSKQGRLLPVHPLHHDASWSNHNALCCWGHMLPQNPSQQSNQGSTNCRQWPTGRNLLVTLCVYKITNKGQSGWKLTSTLQETAKVSVWQKRGTPFGLTGGSGWKRRGAKECIYRMKHLFPSLPQRSFLVFPPHFSIVLY